MSDRPAARNWAVEERAARPERPVDRLVAHHQVPRGDVFLKAARGARRQDVRHAQFLQGKDVRTVGNHRGVELVALAVASEDRHALAAHFRQDDRGGGGAERRVDLDPFAAGFLRQGCAEPASADESHKNVAHGKSPFATYATKRSGGGQ